MKFFKIETAEVINGITQPGIDGRNVEGKEDLFNRACGPNSFFEGEPNFDYLIPKNFHEEDEDKEPTIICDYNYWWGDSPIGGWLKPISEKLKDFFSGFNLGSHRFYDAKLLFKGDKYQYYVLQIFRDSYQEMISFENTLFNNLNASRRLEGDKLEIKKFKSLDDVEDYSDEYWDMEWNYERVVMNPEFRELDFVTFYQFGDLVSERLKLAIEAAGMTGVEFHELPIPIEFSDEI